MLATKFVGGKFKMLVVDLIHWIGHHHTITYKTLSPTSLSPYRGWNIFLNFVSDWILHDRRSDWSEYKPVWAVKIVTENLRLFTINYFHCDTNFILLEKWFWIFLIIWLSEHLWFLVKGVDWFQSTNKCCGIYRYFSFYSDINYIRSYNLV